MLRTSSDRPTRATWRSLATRKRSRNTFPRFVRLSRLISVVDFCLFCFTYIYLCSLEKQRERERFLKENCIIKRKNVKTTLQETKKLYTHTHMKYTFANTGNVEDRSITRDDLMISANSTFERLREETREREEEALVSLALGRYRLLMEGDVKGALEVISFVDMSKELKESASVLRETCAAYSEVSDDVESWSPMNRAAHYDQKKDFQLSIETWNTCFNDDENDDDEITAAALTSLGRRLCLEKKELDRADTVLQRAMRFYTRDPEHDKIRFSYTLAWLGAVQHAQEKAVTAEGLMRE